MLSMLDYKLFYDYKNDPFETDNLFANPEASEKKKEYETKLIELAEKTGDPILSRLKEAITN